MPTTRVSRTKAVEPLAAGRDPMPEATFLQIHGQGGSTARMIELPAGPARVGRGAHCEVRLPDPGLGEVQCILRLRGTTWHFQPVGPPGQVWIDGRPADRQRPLPLGVPFRVGDHWLTLRPADSAINDWGSFDAPIVVEAQVVDSPPDVEAQADPGPPPAEPGRPGPAAKPLDDEERLRRWQARLEQRERWLKDRQDERRWEARWKSAGETIRARSGSAPTAPPTSRPPTRPATVPPVPTQAPPVARIIEPGRSSPLRRAPEPAPRPSTTRVPIRPLATEPPSPSRGPAAPPILRVPIRPAPIDRTKAPTPVPDPDPIPTSRALVALPTTRREPPVDPGPVIIDEPGPSTVAAPNATDRATPGPIAFSEPAGPVQIIDPVPSSDARPASAHAPGEVPELGEFASPPAIEVDVTPPEIEEPANRPVPFEEWPEPTPIEAKEAGPSLEPSRWTEATPAEVPTGPDAANTEWPSARAIFAAQASRPRSASEEHEARRARSVEPEPTDVLAPSQWTLPRWLVWFPAPMIALVLGTAGLALAYQWALEANNANIAMRLALRPDSAPGTRIDPAAIPRGGWWLSNSTHLAAWAMALERSSDGEDHSEEIRSLLEAAEHASRLSARARFVQEPPDSAQLDPRPEFSAIGRPRDVVTLIWTGRRLRKAGKAEASLRAYRSAMEIASKAHRDDLDIPTFDEDPQVRRYALPRESLLGLVVRDMADAGEWTRDQWDQALPPVATASLVASRVFNRRQQRAEADRLADLTIRQAESPPPAGYDPAEHRAAGAEALAFRGRWTDAAEQYRRAIDLVDDDSTRRMWWLNLAELAQRVFDDSGRDRAIEAAKAPDSADEVTRRALRYEQSLPGLASTPPRR